jgi:hypothetical protein
MVQNPAFWPLPGAKIDIPNSIFLQEVEKFVQAL